MQKNLLVVLAGFFCVSLVVSNIIAGKLFLAPFGIILPAAVFLFPVVYIIGDVIPEIYGFNTAKKIILLGFVVNILSVAMFMLTISLPYPEFWKGQSSFVEVFVITPRILIASMFAYLIGTNVNAYTLVFIKKITNEKFLWIRTIGSTIIGESLDSILFITIAFLNIIPNNQIIPMIIAQASFKIIYEILATPLTYLVVGYIKKEVVNE